MRYLIGFVLTVVFLTGCSDNTAMDSPVPERTTDEQYVIDMRKEVPEFQGGNDQNLIDAGKKVCSYFEEQGVTVVSLSVLEDVLSDEWTTEETAAILLISTDAYCPAVKDELLAINDNDGIST